MTQRILLVDDELHILRAAEFKLKRFGYNVICASNGEEAWERIEEQLPDIVVTDLQMPKVNGLELIARMRQDERTAELPVIMLTAKGFELPQDEELQELRIFEVISKPFSPRDVCNRVQMALEDAERRRDFLATRDQ